MTGLDPLTDHILEIACIVTDKKLNTISEELNIVVHQPDTILSQMNEWCMQHHAKVYKLLFHTCATLSCIS